MRRLVRAFYLNKIGNWWLGRFPVTKHLPESGVIYRATRLESIPLAVEMFEQGKLYDATLLPENITTFVDLGCNVGYFTCWLAHVSGGRKLRGLMLDANPAAVTEARWHAQANQMEDVFALNGIVGEGVSGQASEFYLYESNICSTSRMPDIKTMNLPGQWTTIRVPCVCIEDQWRQHFNNTRCHLLKVDIEGSEFNFLKTEQSFLDLVDSILIEWHKWTVNLEELENLLETCGFKRVKIIEETDQMGTVFFSRKPVPK
jgi:FkbM family methyltransferase